MPLTKLSLPPPSDIREHDQSTTVTKHYRTSADEAVESRNEQWRERWRLEAEAAGVPWIERTPLTVEQRNVWWRNKWREDQRLQAAAPTVATIAELARLPRRPNSYSGSNKEEISGQTYCHRAYRRWIEGDDGEPISVWLACRSRTCQDCRPDIDRSDAERVAAGIGAFGWLIEIDAAEWATMSKRLRRHEAVAVRIPSNRKHDRVVVVADEPLGLDAKRLDGDDVASVVRDLMMTRPTGQARRLTTIGEIPSRDDWDDRQRTETPTGRTEWMSSFVQPADVERVAAALGVEVESTASTVRILCPWDDWRAVALRRWCRNPAGKEWRDMRLDTLIGEGAVPAEEPPDPDEQLALVGVA